MELVNLYSDTQTRPTAAMRAAMAAAEVGDEQRREDPTTLALEARVADLLGHEAAVFLPTGTMCNEIAIRLRSGGQRRYRNRASEHALDVRASLDGAGARAGQRGGRGGGKHCRDADQTRDDREHDDEAPDDDRIGSGHELRAKD